MANKDKGLKTELTPQQLEKVFAHSPDSICIADKDGNLIAVNNAFEHTVGEYASNVVGKNVLDLEAEGIFRPSVLRLAKEEERPITIMQVGKHGKQIMVTGIPVFDEDGNVELLVSNARLIDEVVGLYSYVDYKNKAQPTDVFSDKNIIMKSTQMNEIRAVADSVKDTDATVLISGPSGVGKGVLAKYIHNTSNRAKKPMVEINCGAIPEKLIESELFGYEEGAFTGASRKGKIGLIETADGGTLVLDEISEMPLFLQVKLLKVIQDREIMRIGSRKAKKVDVRIIALTNRDLKELVTEGKFREDLFYRLNVIPMNIVPLKYRKEDIEEALQFFVDKFSRKYNRKTEVTKEFKEHVLNLDWPGNMREMENYIERAVLTSKDGVLYIPQDEELGMDLSKNFMKQAEAGDSLNGYLQRAEGEIIKTLYAQYHSSYKVAEELGISQSKAYRLIKKYT